MALARKLHLIWQEAPGTHRNVVRASCDTRSLRAKSLDGNEKGRPEGRPFCRGIVGSVGLAAQKGGDFDPFLIRIGLRLLTLFGLLVAHLRLGTLCAGGAAFALTGHAVD